MLTRSQRKFCETQPVRSLKGWCEQYQHIHKLACTGLKKKHLQELCTEVIGVVMREDKIAKKETKTRQHQKQHKHKDAQTREAISIPDLFFRVGVELEMCLNCESCPCQDMSLQFFTSEYDESIVCSEEGCANELVFDDTRNFYTSDAYPLFQIRAHTNTLQPIDLSDDVRTIRDLSTSCLHNSCARHVHMSYMPPSASSYYTNVFTFNLLRIWVHEHQYDEAIRRGFVRAGCGKIYCPVLDLKSVTIQQKNFAIFKLRPKWHRYSSVNIRGKNERDTAHVLVCEKKYDFDPLFPRFEFRCHGNMLDDVRHVSFVPNLFEYLAFLRSLMIKAIALTELDMEVMTSSPDKADEDTSAMDATYLAYCMDRTRRKTRRKSGAPAQAADDFFDALARCESLQRDALLQWTVPSNIATC